MSEAVIDRIIEDIHVTNIVLNAINGHGKSTSLKTIVARLKEKHPEVILKIFDISLSWYHKAPVPHRLRVTSDMSAELVDITPLNIENCVYEIGSLHKGDRRLFISKIVDQDYQDRYEKAIMMGKDYIDTLPLIVYIFEEATTYFDSWSLKGKDEAAKILYDFITVGRNYGLRSFLVVNREIGSLSTDIRDISPKILGYIEAKSDLSYYKSKSKEMWMLIKSMPRYHWVYYNRDYCGPFKIEDSVENVPVDVVGIRFGVHLEQTWDGAVMILLKWFIGAWIILGLIYRFLL